MYSCLRASVELHARSPTELYLVNRFLLQMKWVDEEAQTEAKSRPDIFAMLSHAVLTEIVKIDNYIQIICTHRKPVIYGHRFGWSPICKSSL